LLLKVIFPLIIEGDSHLCILIPFRLLFEAQGQGMGVEPWTLLILKGKTAATPMASNLERACGHLRRMRN